MLPRHALRVASTAAMRTAARRAARVSRVATTPTPRQAALTMPRRSSSTTDKPSSARVAARVARIAGELGLLQLRKARGVDVAIRSVKFRRAFVRLGPAFVKIGQALATRRDVLPPELCDELSRLQDDIDPSLSGAEAVRVIEHDLEKPIGELFEGLDASSVPVASASLGQVYRARLLTGEEVAVKVQRDDVLETLAIDAVAVRSFVAMISQLFNTETDFAAIADEIVGRIGDELDYAREASDCELFAHLYKNEDVCVPKVYREFCGPRVLTLSYLPVCSIMTCTPSTRHLLDGVAMSVPNPTHWLISAQVFTGHEARRVGPLRTLASPEEAHHRGGRQVHRAAILRGRVFSRRPPPRQSVGGF